MSDQSKLSDEHAYRMNAAAAKVADAMHDAAAVARDECLWLAAKCRELGDEVGVLKARLAMTELSLRHHKDREAQALSAQEARPAEQAAQPVAPNLQAWMLAHATTKAELRAAQNFILAGGTESERQEILAFRGAAPLPQAGEVERAVAEERERIAVWLDQEWTADAQEERAHRRFIAARLRQHVA